MICFSRRAATAYSLARKHQFVRRALLPVSVWTGKSARPTADSHLPLV